MNRLLQIITCSKYHPRSKDYSRQPTPYISPHNSHDTTKLPSENQALEIFGYTLEGSGPGKHECQDTYCILHQVTPHTSFFGVYDGHGLKGKEVSVFVNNRLARTIKGEANNLDRMIAANTIQHFLKKAYTTTDDKLKHSKTDTYQSGTCCITALVSKDRCYIANLGDSRAVLCKQSADGGYKALDLTSDQTPNRPDEKARILKKGGLVEPSYFEGVPIGPLRVWTVTREAGLMMTRAMGDARGKKAGLIAEPEVHEIILHSGDRFIILASDGLWDVMSSQEAVDLVVMLLETGQQRKDIPRLVAREAEKKWEKLDEEEDPENHNDPYCDDITVLIAWINSGPPNPITETLPSSVGGSQR